MTFSPFFSLIVQVKCSVQNGSALVDLTPLIHISGYYTATGTDISGLQCVIICSSLTFVSLVWPLR